MRQCVRLCARQDNVCALPRGPYKQPQMITAIPASRQVDFNVRNDYEFVGNYKELQQAFTKTGIDRVRQKGGWGWT